MTDLLSAHYVRVILKSRRKRYNGADRMFFERIRRKLNEDQLLDGGEDKKLRELYEKELVKTKYPESDEG